MNAESFNVPSLCQCLVCHVIMHQSAVLHIITAAEDKSKRGPFLMIERPKANISSNSFGHFEMRPLSQQLIVYFEETDEKNLWSLSFLFLQIASLFYDVLNPFIHSFIQSCFDDQIIEFFKTPKKFAGDRFLLMIHDI